MFQLMGKEIKAVLGEQTIFNWTLANLFLLFWNMIHFLFSPLKMCMCFSYIPRVDLAVCYPL